MLQIDVQLMLGAFFVVLNTYERFNTPPTNRSSTTALRYHAAAVAYVALGFASFLVLSKYPLLLKAIGQNTLPDDIASLPPALMTALVFTVLLEKMPIFAAMDRWLRAQLQKMANIPVEARRLSRWLQRSEFSAPAHLRERVARSLCDNGFQERDIAFDNGDSMQHLWSKIAVLMENLGQWEAEQPFGSFMAGSVEEFKGLVERYQQLSRKAAWTFKLLSDPAPALTDERGAQLLVVYRAEFREQAEALFAGVCDFVSRGVLRCRLSYTSRCAELRSMGFLERRQRGRGLTLNRIISVFAMVSSILLFGSMLAGARADLTMGQQLLVVAMVATNYCIAVACALYPKRYWQMARRGPDGERPTASYVVWAMAAVVLSQLVNFGFKLMMWEFDLDKTLTDMARSYPWALLIFATAAGIAYLADNDGSLLDRWQRPLEATLLAAATALAAYVTYRWLLSIGNPGAERPQFLPSVLPTTAITGFVLGWVVPTWHRNASHLRRFTRGDESEDGAT